MISGVVIGEMTSKIRVAIDGPAGAGKSSVARLVASRLGYIYIDTGAMYRALTWKAINQQMNLEDPFEIERLLKASAIELMPYGDEQHVLLDGENISASIRTSEVSNRVSIVAKHQQVREEMVERQRSLAKNGGVVMDGRDVGTNVLPNAEVKIFLTASAEVRAKRRHKENLQQGRDSNLEQMISDMALRDKRDRQRKIAPLIKADDAVEIDTTDLEINEVSVVVLNCARERMA